MTLVRRNYGRGHGYKLDGEKITGVTTLIKAGLPAPALMFWSARTVAEYVADADQATLDALRTLGHDGMVETLKKVPWNQAKEKAARGTEVHGLAEKLSRGERVDVPEPLAGHVDSCVRFLDEWRVLPVLTETSIASRGGHGRPRYAGTFDLVADIAGGRRALLDYKTAGKGIFPETALQLAAYRYADFYVDADRAEQPMDALHITHTYAVWLRADGYDMVPVETDGGISGAAFSAFRAAAYLGARKDVMETWIGEALPPPGPSDVLPLRTAVAS